MKKHGDKAEQLVCAIIKQSRKMPRYGSRRIRAKLNQAGWDVSRELVKRVRRAEGLLVRPKPKKRLRRGNSTGLPTKAEHPNHVWTWDFVHDRTDRSGKLRMMTLLDEFTRESLMIHVERKLNSLDVLNVLQEAIIKNGAPLYIRSDNGSEFIAKVVQSWLNDHAIKTIYIDPGSPWQNGFIESFHNRLRDECLNQEFFLSLTEAKVVIENWREFYNEEHPHSKLGFKSPNEFKKNFELMRTKAKASVRTTPSLQLSLAINRI